MSFLDLLPPVKSSRLSVMAIIRALKYLVLFGIMAQLTFSQQNPPPMRVSSPLVVVPASPLDRSGHFIPGLTARDFRIFVDGRPVEIAHFEAVTEIQPEPTSDLASLALPPHRQLRQRSSATSRRPRSFSPKSLFSLWIISTREKSIAWN